MNDAKIEKLELEVELGQKAQRSYNDFIKDFVENKRKDLFQFFCEISVSEPEKLLEVKRLYMVLESLETEVLTIINTGKMAAKILEGV